MPDTDELRSYFGQPGGQRKGCGFPVSHLLGLVDYGTGMLRKLVVSPLRTHDLSVAKELCTEMQRGDIAVYDRGFCSSAHIFMLAKEHGVHSVMRVSASHKVDFRESRQDQEQAYVATELRN